MVLVVLNFSYRLPMAALRFGLGTTVQPLPLAGVTIGKLNRGVDQSSGSARARFEAEVKPSQIFSKHINANVELVLKLRPRAVALMGSAIELSYGNPSERKRKRLCCGIGIMISPNRIAIIRQDPGL